MALLGIRAKDIGVYGEVDTVTIPPMTDAEINAALDKCADEMEALQDYKRNIWRLEDEIRE